MRALKPLVYSSSDLSETPRSTRFVERHSFESHIVFVLFIGGEVRSCEYDSQNRAKSLLKRLSLGKTHPNSSLRFPLWIKRTGGNIRVSDLSMLNPISTSASFHWQPWALQVTLLPALGTASRSVLSATPLQTWGSMSFDASLILEVKK